MYLEDIPFPEAINRLENALREVELWDVLDIERIPLDEAALGRVLAEPIWAKLSSPHYHAAAMDGFAVDSVDTVGAFPTKPIILMGGEKAVYVDTGDQLPDFADAVIPIEDVEPLDEQGMPASLPHQPHSIRIRSAAPPWMHVRPLGEDIVATELVLPAGHKIRPVDLGVIAASGNSSVNVARRPRVAILPTGSELVPIGNQVAPGEIIEFNSLIMAGQILDWGGEATRLPITADDFEQLRTKVQDAEKDHDLILINAGSSAGSEDYSAKVIESLGEVLVHGVAVRPGHPVILGMIHSEQNEDNRGEKEQRRRSIPIIGVPGYPVSAAITGELFVEPLLARWLGRSSLKANKIQATLTRKITSPAGDDDFVRVAVGRVGNRILAAPLARGAGVISSLVRADGLALLPRGSQGMSAGSDIEVRLYRSLEEIENTIFVTGSHDVILDIMAQFLYRMERRLVATSIGSIGGLVALSRQEAHMAGAHLLDPETGEYNLPFIDQYLPDIPVKIIALVGRRQGMIVQKGNPKQIKSLHDLSRDDVTFVNRQRGAGTRLLLDYHLKMSGISKNSIKGYDHQEFTHLAVGAAVASGRADCGVGIAAVTKSLDLDFVPLAEERYDLIIPEDYSDEFLIEPLFKVLEDEDFQKMVAQLPGYDMSRMGELIT